VPYFGCFLIPFQPKFFEESDDTKRRDYLFGLGGGYFVPYFACFLIPFRRKILQDSDHGEEHGIHSKANLKDTCTWVFTFTPSPKSCLSELDLSFASQLKFAFGLWKRQVFRGQKKHSTRTLSLVQNRVRFFKKNCKREH